MYAYIYIFTFFPLNSASLRQAFRTSFRKACRKAFRCAVLAAPAMPALALLVLSALSARPRCEFISLMIDTIHLHASVKNNIHTYVYIYICTLFRIL